MINKTKVIGVSILFILLIIIIDVVVLTKNETSDEIIGNDINQENYVKEDLETILMKFKDPSLTDLQKKRTFKGI